MLVESVNIAKSEFLRNHIHVVEYMLVCLKLEKTSNINVFMTRNKSVSSL